MIVTSELGETARYVLTAFREAGETIVTAESCTGGMIAALLTDYAGSSDVFERGFVTYSNHAKMECLGVRDDVLDQYGAVSAETAMAMAEGALAHSRASVAVAVTGIAGPGGGSAEKPVGLVYVGIAGPMGLFVEELQMGAIGREQIRAHTAQAALEMLVAFGLDEKDSDLPGEPDFN